MHKVTNLLQMAFKARKIALGSELIPSIQTKKAHLVLISDLCGSNRMKKLQDKCSYYHVACMVIDDQILSSVSYKNISAIAVCDDGFAKAIIQNLKG